jgi:hypothetical protein
MSRPRRGLCSKPCDESSPRRVRPPRDVVKVTVFLTDVNDRTAINPVRQEFFGDARPASTLEEISRLAIPGATIEVEAVAAPRTSNDDG